MKTGNIFNRDRQSGLAAADLVWFLAFALLACAFFVPDYYRKDGASLALSRIEKDLADMRGALSEYRDSTDRGNGKWPAELKEAASSLKDGRIPSTPEEAGFTAANGAVITVDQDRPLTESDFTGAGGWIYNPVTGELRANLRKGAWGLDQNWLSK